MRDRHRLRLLLLGTLAAVACAATAADKVTGSSPHYLRMKHAQIVDGDLHMPAINAMIPVDWQFKGLLRYMGGMGGCFADFKSVFIHAQSADGSMVFESIPDFTWQYADDPNTQRTMSQEAQGYARAGVKPCPVMRPARSADFLQQVILPRYRSGKQLLSIDPYPELNLFLRQRLGLPVNDGGNSGPVLTDAARAHLQYERDGQMVEEWITVAEWMRFYPSGRGNIYDCHAVMLMSFKVPQGRLEANEKLFKLMAFNITPEPKWQAQVNSMIATLYQKQQVEEAKRSQMIAQFQQHVADTIRGVTENSMRGANQAAFGEDQIVRGVQTFRNPETGETFELSNLHDHAWLNGSNEYIMSDDPNFNPNGQLNGNWTPLEPVQAQP